MGSSTPEHFCFRNSLVFHSIDKMTSVYIHTAPSIMSFAFRWYPKECSKLWPLGFPVTFDEWNYIWNILLPIAVLLTHAILYTILVYCILKPSEETITSFRYLKSRGIFRCFLNQPRFYHFIAGQILTAVAMSGVTIITYSYFFAHLAQVLIILIVIIWNGASFYVYVFLMSLNPGKLQMFTTNRSSAVTRTAATLPTFTEHSY